MHVLAASSVDRVLTMQTYTDNFTIFYQNMESALQALPLNKLGIGVLCRLMLHSGHASVMSSCVNECLCLVHVCWLLVVSLSVSHIGHLHRAVHEL